MNNTYSITVHFHKFIEDWEWGKLLQFSSEYFSILFTKNHMRSHNVSWHCIRQEIAPKGKVNGHSSRHALIGLFGHCPEAKTSAQCRIQSTDLTLARSPVASDFCRWISDFQKYSPGLLSWIFVKTFPKNWKNRRTYYISNVFLRCHAAVAYPELL